MERFLGLRSIPGLLMAGVLLVSQIFAAPGDDTVSTAASEKSRKEELLAREKGIKDQFKYSFEEVSSNLVTVACRSEYGRSSGSGFIANMDGKTYLFTNQHVILGADRISFKTISGEALNPRGVELSRSRDIARLLLEYREDALKVADGIRMGSPIGVFGNSEGAGVATELYGNVSGLGADLIEVTADFVAGNSGSPVLNLNQEVVGIASYVKFSSPSMMKMGTRFENKIRRFCYRLNGDEWMAVNWKKLNSTYGKAYVANERLISYLNDTFIKWGADPLSSVGLDMEYAQSIKYWARGHNNLLAKRQQGKSPRFHEEYKASAKRLGRLCILEAERIEGLTVQRGLSGFLLEEFEKQISTLKYYNDVCVFFGDQIYR